jgi:hypothetical protein
MVHFGQAVSRKNEKPDNRNEHNWDVSAWHSHNVHNRACANEYSTSNSSISLKTLNQRCDMMISLSIMLDYHMDVR